MQAEVLKHFRYNLTVKVLDTSIYGFGFGFASTVTILPLFLSTLTDSTTLIGLIASIQLVGWQFPQLLVARRVAGQSVYKPMVLRLTLQERWPFVGLAVVALLAASIPAALAVLLTFVLFTWHALGSGLTATPYQSLIARIVPAKRRGAFWGAQSAGFSLMSAVSAIIAGQLLSAVTYPQNFALCFFLAGLMMAISWLFLASTREPAIALPPQEPTNQPYWRDLWALWKQNSGFRWFTAARVFSQFALMGLSFYTIYSVRRFEVEPATIGVMTSLLLLSETAVHPLCGWLGDRLGHRLMLAAGAITFAVANLLAVSAPDANWLYLVFALGGAGNAIFTTSTLALTLEFGTERERPYYIGLGNTLVAPFTLAAPIVGGLLIDTISYGAMFVVTIIAAVIMMLVLLVRLPDSRRVVTSEPVD